MFDIKKEDVQGLTNKLLYNIWQSLEALKCPTTSENNLVEPKVKETVSCKFCGELFTNKGKLLSHYKSCKKKQRG